MPRKRCAEFRGMKALEAGGFAEVSHKSNGVPYPVKKDSPQRPRSMSLHYDRARMGSLILGCDASASRPGANAAIAQMGFSKASSAGALRSWQSATADLHTFDQGGATATVWQELQVLGWQLWAVWTRQNNARDSHAPGWLRRHRLVRHAIACLGSGHATHPATGVWRPQC